MVVFAKAMKFLQDENQGDSRTLELIHQIIISNDNIPIIVTDKNGVPIPAYFKNISEEDKKDPHRIKKRLKEMKAAYPPFELQISENQKQYLYFDNSDLMNNIRYYPYILAVFILCYIFFIYWFLITIKRTDEGYLWAGLAKETAHQIGTPLSSMIGWVEVLKLNEHQCENQSIQEIEKDINRLKTISERFSKIGSIPELKDLNLSETLTANFNYLRTRISKKINFRIHLPQEPILMDHSRELMSWVVENLVKNAVDAMKGEGEIQIKMVANNKMIFIDFQDSGCGMSKKQIRKIFNPGFSTKKRGWGLGLSLVRRVICDYHHGEIKVLNSEVRKGTTFRITFKNKA